MRETYLHPGRVGRDLAKVDWSATAVGPPESWSQSLRTVVRMLLSSRFSMWMAWGPELTFFCNDAYRRDTLGAKYPWALGRPASEVWSEVWPEVQPRVERVLTRGESTWDENLELFLERSGYREETYHTFSYSPLADDDGGVAGMLCVVTETTEQVVGSRRMKALSDIATALADVLTEEETLSTASRVLAECTRDLPFHLVYLHDDRGGCRLAASAGLPADHPLAPAVITDGAGPWPLPATTDVPGVVDLPQPLDLPAPLAQLPVSRAAVVPIPGAQESSYGFLVVGLNPFRPHGSGYADFLALVAGHLGAAITDARAYDLERRRAEELAELDRAKTDFFTNVSHEFRTPLTLLLGPVEDALADQSDPLSAGQRERLDVVRRNALRLLKLVNTLLSFSRLEAGRVQAEFEPVDLAAYTADLASMFRSAAERLGLRLEVDCEPLSEDVHVDPELWAEVVLNLLSNALKFTLDGGIAVALRSDDDHAVLTVRDSGVGIPEAGRADLFQRFRRVVNTRSRSHEGSGIGLALVAEVAQLHGGDVSVVSEPGVGSTFEVRVPFGSAHLPADQVVAHGRRTTERLLEGFLTETRQFAVEPERPPAAGTTPAPSTTGDRPRVLVADDNADVRRYIARILSDEHDVETAVDGRDALERALAQPPDLVLTDVMMPVLDGLALLAELRAHPQTAGIPVVMISARGGDDARVEGLEAGADDYVVKPFAARELRARVRATLELDRTRRIREELERSQALLHEAQRLARLGSWSFELDEHRLTASPTLLDMLERDHADLETAGFPGFLLDVSHPDDRERVRVILESTAPGEQVALEVRVLRRDGSHFLANLRGEIVAEEGGGTVARGTLQDVTERRRTADVIAAAQATAEVAAREHQIAAELQNSLLPEQTFDLKHLEVATFYRPGLEGTEVGGDWYDVIALPDGRTALVMGDVMGHGVHAAAVMGQLRTAVRAYARLGMPPQALMESVDLLVWDLFPDQIVTCVYAEFDPEELTVSMLNAGHVPPLVIGPQLSAAPVRAEAHPPLGLGRPFPEPHVVRLDPGASLLLYTDGLVERRGRDLETGIAALAGVAGRTALPLDALPEALVDAMVPEGPDDDVALLVARVPRAAG